MILEQLMHGCVINSIAISFYPQGAPRFHLTKHKSLDYAFQRQIIDH